jgi:hypothetical protein
MLKFSKRQPRKTRKRSQSQKKKEPIPEKLEKVHVETRTISSIDFSESSKTNESSMSSAKPLREFKQMAWILVDFGEVFDKRRL